ncbi:hypothetical protein LPW36_15380 [Jinshanibacter sp. LJY008]|uniref:Sel1 repeat family protein n=1 Tax=Limnobaculum eriocheiris TaxID=2897391 RepID=A0A9X1SR04_9GAMM|nr:hypothetical protein [Limnobaculum eriocheiris]MCD1127357.1 hypothetical protein [Limnobaculum eriocheiris]
MTITVNEDDFKSLCDSIRNGSEKDLAILIGFAEQGHSDSQWFLGWLYANGVVLNKSEKKSDYWFRLAIQGPQYSKTS